MRQAIDVHCHFNKFDTFPDKYTVHLIANQFPAARCLLTEEAIRDGRFLNRVLFKVLARVSRKTAYIDRLVTALGSGNFWGNKGVLQTLITHGEYLIHRDYLATRQGGPPRRVLAYTPLMMDFIQAAGIGELGYEHGAVPFMLQIYEHVVMSRYYPWQVFPFFHFHPRRKGVMALARQAIEDQGFLGFKLYPAMGFYPDPADRRQTDPGVTRNLKDLYNYLRDLRGRGIEIPITAHAQHGSTQSIHLKMDQTTKFTDIANWNGVIGEYDLKINFAHYGGMNFLADPGDAGQAHARNFSRQSREKIRHLMQTFNRDGRKRIFADCSAHNPNDRHFESYLPLVNRDLQEERHLLMYGTDLPVVTLNTLNRDCLQAWDQGLSDPDARDRFFINNALAFLFEQGRVPRTRTAFLREAYAREGAGRDPDDIRDVPWVTREAGGEFRVDPAYR